MQNIGASKHGVTRNILLGVSLGPIFTSCSPTYGIVLATVFPTNYSVGVLNVVLYAFGLALVLALIAIGGQKLVEKMSWASKSNGVFRKSLGILLVVVGILIATGLIRDLETWWAGSSFNFNGFEIDQVKRIQK